MSTLLNCPIDVKEWQQETHSAARLFPNGDTGTDLHRARETQLDRWEEMIDRIVAMQHLGDDWDGLGAQAPSKELLACAIGLAYLLKEDGMEAPSCAVASTAGAVVLEWHEPDGTSCEVEIDRLFHADVMLLAPGQPPQHWELPVD